LSNSKNYIIYALKSGSVYQPYKSDIANPNTIFLQKNYNFIFPTEITLKQIYLLVDYIYLDREERTKFFQNKHTYLVEQVYFSNPRYLTNKYNRNSLEIVNPCKYFVFMGQVKYFLNSNVNYLFNYNTLFFDPQVIQNTISFLYNPVINNASFSLNSSVTTNELDMKYYSVYSPFIHFPMTYKTNGFGLASFSLYPDNLQPSGSCNMSSFYTFDINTYFNNIDINYNNYVFKAYTVTYNYFRIVNGVAATIFTSNF